MALDTFRSRGLLLCSLLTLGIAAAWWCDLLLFPSQRQAITAAAIAELQNSYVFPGRVANLKSELGEPSPWLPTLAPVEAILLSRRLQELLSDRHLRVGYSLAPLPADDDRPPTRDEIQQERATEAADGFGIVEVKFLPKNVGYVELRRFAPPEFSADAIANLMNRLSGASALMLDLRQNRGGDPRTGVLLASYFFENPVHWVTLRSRNGSEELWTATDLPGRRFLDKPVFVLTSRRTFSAGEGFAYHMRNLRRATIVGERTAGGANPGIRKRLTSHFWLFVPTARAVSPVTGTNWEGLGIIPDVETDASDALNAALRLASR